MLRTELQLAWKTQAGHRHHVEGLGNEDAVFVTESHPNFDAVMIVADGMGGHPRPSEASEAAVNAAKGVLSDEARCGGDTSRAVLAALAAAHRAVTALRESPYGKAPGTTLSIAVVTEGVLHVAHAGDGSVFLMREGQVRVLAGGEEQRTGNRPAQYLGQDGPLDPELRQMPLAGGDRVLLCTDGLTRYFRDAGPEALERVLGRPGVNVQSIASQLTAHSRPGEYDDDTTVAVAEVAAISSGGAGPAARRAEPRRSSPEEPWTLGEPMREGAKEFAGSRSGRVGDVILIGLVAALGGTALFALGYVLGRIPAPETAPLKVASPFPKPVAPQDLPEGNIVLVDRLGNRVYSLGTRAKLPTDEEVQLKGWKLDEGRFKEIPGQFTLIPQRGQLKGPKGNTYPVEVDAAGGSIRVVQGGSLTIKADVPNARVFLNGTLIGSAPQTVKLPAGRYEVSVRGRDWSSESRVEVPADRSVSLTLGPR